MNSKNLIQYISSKYHVKPNYFTTPNNECVIFRHTDTGRWFALLIIEFPLEKTGQQTTRRIDVLNLHLKKEDIADWKQDKEFFQTYHMDPDSWKTIPLDGTVEDSLLQQWIDLSFDSTASDT